MDFHGSFFGGNVFCEVIYIISANFIVIHKILKTYKYFEVKMAMTNYLINSGVGYEHYFFRPYEGICKKERLPGDTWKEHKSVLPEGREPFGVYKDHTGCVHLICTDSENRLIYSSCKDGVWKKYVLSSINKDIYISDMRLYSMHGRLNLLYSALYDGENMLIHCILAGHAKPSVVDTLETPHFFTFDSKVYYTNAKGELGYVLLGDEKPCGFNKLYSDAHHPTVINFDGREFLIFTRESKLFVNGEEILYDSRMETPTCINNFGKLCVMWKSGNFIRYTTTFNGGITWSEPMRFINSGSIVSSFLVQEGNSVRNYFGYKSEKNLVILGSPDFFSDEQIPSCKKGGDIERLQALLDMAHKEVLDAKNEISRLNKTIENLRK